MIKNKRGLSPENATAVNLFMEPGLKVLLGNNYIRMPLKKGLLRQQRISKWLTSFRRNYPFTIKYD